jgi:hypothetical protein
MPVTPDKVWQVIQEAKARASTRMEEKVS